MSGDLQQKIGRSICKYRKAAGFTQELLSDKLQVAHETVSRMERGVSMPSVMTLYRIARALGVEVQDFFAPEASTSEKAQALDDLFTLLKQRRPNEIRMVKELASVALGQLDKHYVPKPPPK